MTYTDWAQTHKPTEATDDLCPPTKKSSQFYWQDLLFEMLNKPYQATDMIGVPYEIRKAYNGPAGPDNLPPFLTPTEFKGWYQDLQEVAYKLDAKDNG